MAIFNVGTSIHLILASGLLQRKDFPTLCGIVPKTRTAMHSSVTDNMLPVLLPIKPPAVNIECIQGQTSFLVIDTNTNRLLRSSGSALWSKSNQIFVCHIDKNAISLQHLEWIYSADTPHKFIGHWCVFNKALRQTLVSGQWFFTRFRQQLIEVMHLQRHTHLHLWMHSLPTAMSVWTHNFLPLS